MAKVRFSGGEIGALIYLAIIIAGIGGWIANIVKIIGSDFSDVTGLLVMRVIGVFMPPLGAVLGFV